MRIYSADRGTKPQERNISHMAQEPHISLSSGLQRAYTSQLSLARISRRDRNTRAHRQGTTLKQHIQNYPFLSSISGIRSTHAHSSTHCIDRSPRRVNMNKRTKGPIRLTKAKGMIYLLSILLFLFKLICHCLHQKHQGFSRGLKIIQISAF